jgi:MFS family permease
MNFWERMGANQLVWALSLARMGDAIGNSMLFVVIPLYVSALPHPLLSLNEPLLVAVLISTYGFLTAILQPLAGGLGDWLRRRKLLVEIGLAMMLAATIGFIWANRYLDLLWLRVGQGVGVSLTLPASLALMAIGTRNQTRGGSMGIFTTFRMIGFSVGPLLGGFLLDRFGYRVAFCTGAGFVGLGLLAVALWVHEEPQGRPPNRFRLFEAAMFKPGILAVSSATLVMAVAFSELVPLEKQVNARTHETALGFGLSFTALMVSRILLQFPMGHWSDRIGRKPLILMGLIALAPATALLATSGSVLALAGWRATQGIAAAAIAAPAFAVAADLAILGGEGRQMSIATMGFSLGIAIGPLLTGWLVRYFFELPFLISAVLCLASALLVYLFVPETANRATCSELGELSTGE